MHLWASTSSHRCISVREEHNLKYMGIGMLGIFMIIGIIIAATYAVAFFTSGRSKKDDI